MRKLIQFLLDVGAYDTMHSGRSLGQHLMGTYYLLRKAGCEEQVAIGGALHSIYGTNAFQKAMLRESDRQKLASFLGAKAERLAWLFGHLKRPACLEDGTAMVGPEDLRELRLIEAANLIEQKGVKRLEKYPNIRAVWEDQCARKEAA
jgi:hypothetical protein